MARRRGGSVRIGPISMFTLVIVLCLAVLSVLAVTTAQSMYNLADRQAMATEGMYQNESAAQDMLASVDAVLQDVRTSNADGRQDAAADALEEALPGIVDDIAADYQDVLTVEASVITMEEARQASATVIDEDTAARTEAKGSALSAEFQTAKGRTLNVVLRINDDATYKVLSWKTNTVWSEAGPGADLWSGPTD